MVFGRKKVEEKVAAKEVSSAEVPPSPAPEVRVVWGESVVAELLQQVVLELRVTNKLLSELKEPVKESKASDDVIRLDRS